MLYVGNGGSNTISAYVIDQESGLLTELDAIANPGSPQSLVIHPSGKFVHTANGGGGVGPPNLATFSINPDTGGLALVGTSTVANGSGPQGMALDAAGKFVFLAQQGTNTVSVFSIDATTGATSPVPGSPFSVPQAPTSVVVHPNGKFAYVSAAGAGQIGAYSIASNGALSPIQGSPFAARNNMPWMTMDRAGKFLFVAERQDQAVLVYAVNDTTGALTQVGVYPSGAGVSGVAVDAEGKFLYASNAAAGSVTVFRIGESGALTRQREFGAILGAFAVILDPSGKFLYVPGSQANAVAGMAIEIGTGTLTPLPQQFFPAGVQPLRGAAVLLTPPVVPPISGDEAFNDFSHAPLGLPNGGIAQGARISVFGKNIGPARGVDSKKPLAAELEGVSMQIQSGDVTTAVLMTSVSHERATGVVPSTTPLGEATVTVSYKGRKTAALPIQIVPVSVGIRTASSTGGGPAIAFNVPPGAELKPDMPLPPQNALHQSAKPGQVMLVQATGLGAVSADETQELAVEMDVPAEVMVGNKTASILVKLRVAEGNDFVAFQLPGDVVEGCYVPLAIRAAGVTSNVATISVASDGGACSDPTGLAASDIEAAQKSGQIRMGTIILSHNEFGPFGADETINGIFARYDFNDLLGAWAPGIRGEGVRAAFVTPALGTCSVHPGNRNKANELFYTTSAQTPSLALNAGPAINVSGPSGTVQLASPSYVFHPDGTAIKAGDYTADNGSGTPTIGAFKAAMTMPPAVTWTNKDDVKAVDRTKDLTVTWSGGDEDKEFALIGGLSVSKEATRGFLCAEKVSAGKFTIPAWVLSSLPKSDELTDGEQTIIGGLLGVGTFSLTKTGRFSADGLDFGVLSYERVTLNLVPFQ